MIRNIIWSSFEIIRYYNEWFKNYAKNTTFDKIMRDFCKTCIHNHHYDWLLFFEATALSHEMTTIFKDIFLSEKFSLI